MRALSLLTLMMGAMVCSGATITFYGGPSCADIGNAQNVGPNAAGCQGTLISTFASFGAGNIADLEAIALGTQNGSLGTANGVTLTASCTNCETVVLGGVSATSTNELGYDTTTLSTATGRFYQVVRVAGGGALPSIFTLNFSTGINGFGAYITGMQTSLGVTTVSFNPLESAQTFVLPTTGQPNGPTEQGLPAGSQFFGFAASGGLVTSITFTTVNSVGVRDVWGIDDFIIGGVVPEPATFGFGGRANREVASEREGIVPSGITSRSRFRISNDSIAYCFFQGFEEISDITSLPCTGLSSATWFSVRSSSGFVSSSLILEPFLSE
jgi:hypothetical protein